MKEKGVATEEVLFFVVVLILTSLVMFGTGYNHHRQFVSVGKDIYYNGKVYHPEKYKCMMGDKFFSALTDKGDKIGILEVCGCGCSEE